MELQSKGLATLIVDGRNIEEFQTLSGGAVTAETLSDLGPGERYPTQAGGEPSIEPITLGRYVRAGRDTAELRRFLRARVGKTDAATVGYKDRDDDGNPVADGDTYVGTITSVNPPEFDRNSKNQAKTLTVIVAPSRVT